MTNEAVKIDLTSRSHCEMLEEKYQKDFKNKFEKFRQSWKKPNSGRIPWWITNFWPLHIRIGPLSPCGPRRLEPDPRDEEWYTFHIRGGISTLEGRNTLYFDIGYFAGQHPWRNLQTSSLRPGATTLGSLGWCSTSPQVPKHQSQLRLLNPWARVILSLSKKLRGLRIKGCHRNRSSKTHK